MLELQYLTQLYRLVVVFLSVYVGVFTEVYLPFFLSVSTNGMYYVYLVGKNVTLYDGNIKVDSNVFKRVHVFPLH